MACINGEIRSLKAILHRAGQLLDDAASTYKAAGHPIIEPQSPLFCCATSVNSGQLRQKTTRAAIAAPNTRHISTY
jgi:hypothetical protein